MTIIEYLESKGCQFKGNGRETATSCVFCDDNKRHMYVNREKEVFHCVKCNEAGNIWKLKKHYGELEVYQPKKKEVFIKPKPALVDKLITDLGEVAIDYLTKERGFTPKIIKEFNLGYKEGFISIPYQKNREVVNIKYRSIKSKQYIREEGGESILYNVDSINKTKDIILVEGEFDCISAYQLGFKNIISTSVGAGGFKDEWTDFFDECIGNVYMAYDNDEAGDTGAERIVDRIGRYRCYRVKLPQKDFNDCLMAGFTKEELQNCFDEAKSYRLPNLITLGEGLERLEEKLFSENSEGIGVKIPSFPSLNDKLGGLRESEITIITGETGCGKTTYSLNIIYDLLQAGKRVLIISTEMNITAICGKFCSMYLGKPYFITSREKLKEAIFELAKHCLFFVDIHGEMSIDSIANYMEYTKRKYNVSFVLLDHLHYFLRSNDKMVQEIENFMRGLVAAALKTKMNILLIAHPSKLKNETGYVHMNDVKGSSSIKQDSHNIITMWRDREKEEVGENEVIFNLEKVRDDSGKIGKFKLEFESGSQRYREMVK